MARLVPRAILGKFKIKGLDVDEWQNYVSPDIPCGTTHSFAIWQP